MKQIGYVQQYPDVCRLAVHSVLFQSRTSNNDVIIIPNPGYSVEPSMVRDPNGYVTRAQWRIYTRTHRGIVALDETR
jgi:hypothetical protein